MRQHSKTIAYGALSVAVAILLGCSQAGSLPEDGVLPEDTGTESTTFSIRGRTFRSSFGKAGVVELVAGQTVSVAAAVRLFDTDPAETPASGWITLPSSSVTVTPTATGEQAQGSRSLPLNGTATIRISIAAGSSTDLCDDAQFMTEYKVILTTGVVGVVDEQQELNAAALSAIAENEVTICTEVTADFEGELTLGDFSLTFDGGTGLPTFALHNLTSESIGLLMPGEVFEPATLVAAGGTRISTLEDARPGESITIRAGTNVRGMVDSTTCPPIDGPTYVADVEWTGTTFACTARLEPIDEDQDGSEGTIIETPIDEDQGVLEGTSIQVPIDSFAGVAVPAVPTNTYNGVDYAIVGVLDANTEDAPTASGETAVTVDLHSLGLDSVETIHFATYSAWVPDLADGITIATVTLSFAGATEAETVPLVLGADTADWSYDRSEHTTLLGGVRHDKAQVLYSFETSLDSASEYSAYVYALTIDIDPPSRLSGIDLTIAPPDTLPSRPDAVDSATWAGQSVPAITLVGPPATTDDDVDGEEGDAGGGDAGGGTDPEMLGSASVMVVNAVTGEPLSGALVTVDGTVASGTTSGAGSFTFNDLPAGGHTLEASLTGYVTDSVAIVVARETVTETSIGLYAACTVTGEVVDAQTGQLLPGAQIGIEGTSAVAMTDSLGVFTIDNAPEGPRTLGATLSGYVPSTMPVTLTPDETTEVSIGLLAIGAGGDGVAVVLSWGRIPVDLDLHLSGPDGIGGRFHIAFYALNPVPHGSLDLDDVTSFGPETVTISPTQAGTYVAGDYHVWIHNFTGEAGFEVSGGLVTLFAGGAQFAQFEVGDASGDSMLDIWRVIEFSIAEDGAVSNVNPLDSYEGGTEQTQF